jgi:hypothetical protein
MMQLRWGKVLTAPHGPGVLRGTFEYAFEIVPAMVLQQARFPSSCEGVPAFPFFDPCAFSIRFNNSETIFGGGFTPLVFQWNFTSNRRFIPFFQIAGGALWTTRDFPDPGSSFNFTPQGGMGAYWLTGEHHTLSFGARFHHISNAGITDPNPGHNAIYFYGGFSWWK